MIANIDPTQPTQREMEELAITKAKAQLASGIAVAAAVTYDNSETVKDATESGRALGAFASSAAEFIIESTRPKGWGFASGLVS